MEGFWAILPDNTVQQDYLSKAKYRFDRKLEKLNANYIHKHYNGLYLFLHPTERMILMQVHCLNI